YAPYAEILQSSLQETLKRLGYSCRSYVLEAFVDSLARWKPFPDANPALKRLAQHYQLAILSNIDRSLLGQSLRHLAVRFAALLTAEDARAYKPNPEIFRHALERLGCLPQDVVHVAFGADYDLAPASSVGMRVVYVNRKKQPRPDLPLEAEIQSLEQLPELWEAESSGGVAAENHPG
ncbi:MAG: HAD-IA family hydrolase, partial [Acidobacteria bacterium]|nr:HAD-IA family hydrolase [Acidobacteriota bacterium]